MVFSLLLSWDRFGSSGGGSLNSFFFCLVYFVVMRGAYSVRDSMKKGRRMILVDGRGWHHERQPITRAESWKSIVIHSTPECQPPYIHDSHYTPNFNLKSSNKFREWQELYHKMFVNFKNVFRKTHHSTDSEECMAPASHLSFVPVDETNRSSFQQKQFTIVGKRRAWTVHKAQLIRSSALLCLYEWNRSNYTTRCGWFTLRCEGKAENFCKCIW